MFSDHQAELKRFQKGGEPMMLVAKDADDGHTIIDFPPHLVNRVASKEERTSFRLAHPNLKCCVSHCDAKVSAHFRTAKRSSFVHGKGSALHTAISIWHLMAQTELVRWAKAQEGVINAEAEVTADDRSRRPDVVVWLTSGRRIAIEVQYSPLSVNDFTARDDELQREFDARVWILGHLPPHFSVRENEVVNTALAAAIASARQFPVWINPGMPGGDEGLSNSPPQILTAWTGRDAHGPILRPGRDARYWALSSLEECSIDPTFGFLTPHGRSLVEARNRRGEHSAHAKDVKATPRSTPRRTGLRQVAQAKALERWDRSPDKEWLMEWQVGESGPGYVLQLGAVGPSDERLSAELDVTCEHWKTVILRHIEQANDWVTWKELCRTLRSSASPDSRPDLTNEDWRTLERFVRSLRDKRLIRLKARNSRPIAAPLHLTPSKTPDAVPITPRPSPPTAPLSTDPRADVTSETADAGDDVRSADKSSTTDFLPATPTEPPVGSPADIDPPTGAVEPADTVTTEPEGARGKNGGWRGWVSRLFRRL